MSLLRTVEAGRLSHHATNLRKEESEDHGVTNLNSFDLFLSLYECAALSNLETAVDQKMAFVEYTHSA